MVYVGGCRLTSLMTITNFFEFFPGEVRLPARQFTTIHNTNRSIHLPLPRRTESLRHCSSPKSSISRALALELDLLLHSYLGSFREERKFVFGLDIQTPPVFWVYFGGSKMPSRQVFGCLGFDFRIPVVDDAFYVTHFGRKKYSSQNNYDRIILEVIRGTPPKTN